MNNRLTLSEFLNELLNCDWTLETIKYDGLNNPIMILTSPYQNGMIQFETTNFSGDTEVIVSRNRKPVISEKAKYLSVYSTDITVSFGDEEDD